jgi:hypothetical protein
MLSQQTIGRGFSLVVGGCLLLSAATAQAVYSTPPTTVNAIEQAQSTFEAGSTFVHLQNNNARCVGRPDGFYVLQNDAKQLHVLELLVKALGSSLLVTINHNPSTCVISSVGVCTTSGLC